MWSFVFSYAISRLFCSGGSPGMEMYNAYEHGNAEAYLVIPQHFSFNQIGANFEQFGKAKRML